MRYLVFLALAIMACSCSSSLSVLTYNIYHGESPYKKGQSNQEEVSTLIKNLDPDVVFLQEVDSMTNRTATFSNGKKVDIARALGGVTNRNGYFAKAIDFSDGGYGEGILTKNPSEIIRLSLPVPSGGEGRALIGVKDESGKKKLILAGTHLCHQHVANRMAQLGAIVAYYEKEKLPMVLAGDFNFRPDSEEYQFITKHFYDMAVIAGHPENTYPSEGPKNRIDYIFLSKNHRWKVKEIKTLQSLASDHVPVYGVMKY